MKYLKLALLIGCVNPIIGMSDAEKAGSVAYEIYDSVQSAQKVINLAKLMVQRQNITYQDALDLLLNSYVSQQGYSIYIIPSEFSAANSFNLGYFTDSNHKTATFKQPLSIYYAFVGDTRPLKIKQSQQTIQILNNKIVFVTPNTHLKFDGQYTVITVPGLNPKLSDFDIIDASGKSGYLPAAGILENNYLSLLCDYTAIVLDLSQDSKGTLVLGQAWTFWDNFTTEEQTINSIPNYLTLKPIATVLYPTLFGQDLLKAIQNVTNLAKLMAQKQSITYQQAFAQLPSFSDSHRDSHEKEFFDSKNLGKTLSVARNFSAKNSFNLGYFTDAQHKTITLKQPLSIYYGFVGGSTKQTTKIVNFKIVFVTPKSKLTFDRSKVTVITVPAGLNLKLSDFDIIDANGKAGYLPTAGILEDKYLSLLSDYTAIVLNLSQDSKGTLVLGQAWALGDPTLN
jgi:hypothetical protein